MIERLGREINDENSVYYWCYTNEIPVFCPALTDGSLGDMMFFHSIRNPGLVLDILGGKLIISLLFISVLENPKLALYMEITTTKS